MKKEAIIQELYKNKTIANLVYRYNENEENLKDLEQDIWLLITTLPSDLLEELYNNGKLTNWISATVKNQVKSKTSHYYRQYKEFSYKSKEINYATDNGEKEIDE